MRQDIPRITHLLSVMLFISTINVSAQPMSVSEGSVFNFEWIRSKSCVDVYPYQVYDIEVGEKDIKEIVFRITDINYDDESVDYIFLMDEENGSISSTLSTNQVEKLIHPRYEISINDASQTISNMIYYDFAMINPFILSDFEEINNQIRDSLNREDDNHLEEAIELEFMGKNSIEEGEAKLFNDNRQWSIYLYFQELVFNILSDIKVWREWEYNKDGILIFSKLRKETKQVDKDDWCSFEEIFKNTDSIFSGLYGIKISIFPFLIILILLFIWIIRKKIRKSLKKVMT